MKGLRWRVPDGTPQQLADVADSALETIKKVMDGEFLDPAVARARLAAAAILREEVCGKVAQKHTGSLAVIHVQGALPRTPGDPPGGLASSTPIETDGDDV